MLAAASRPLVPALGAEFALPPCLVVPPSSSSGGGGAMPKFGPVTYRWRRLDESSGVAYVPPRSRRDWEWTASVDGSVMKRPGVDLEAALMGDGGVDGVGLGTTSSSADAAPPSNAGGLVGGFDLVDRAFVRLDDGALVYPKVRSFQKL
jgi:hypothetical protein